LCKEEGVVNSGRREEGRVDGGVRHGGRSLGRGKEEG